MDVKVSPYETVIVETYREVKPGKRGTIHVRPVSGQPFPTNMDVECSYKVREEYPVGTKFKISARLKNRPGEPPHLYCHYRWPMEVVEE